MYMIKQLLILGFAFLLGASPVVAQQQALRTKIEAYTKDKEAIVAVAITRADGTDAVHVRAAEHLPMQSVFKFHIAVAMLTAIDKGQFMLEQPVKIKKKELTPEIWSPLRDTYPQGVTLPLSELLRYMLAESDNVACDILLKMLGGPAKVDRFFKDRAVQDLAIAINEKTMQRNWDMQYRNWTTAAACTDLIQTYFANSKQELSVKSHAFLWDVMKGTQTGLKRLKGDLPVGTVVAHKTGFSGTRNGITAAVNDAGAIFMPDGTPIFITVFVSESKESLETNEAIIANIARMSYDYFKQKKVQ